MLVHEFAIGMGPKVFSKVWGETRYSLRLFPIGGFVSVEGEDESSDSPRSFGKAKLLHRILFVCAGALMNLLFGFLILLALVGMRQSIPTTQIGGFYPDAVSSQVLQAGDQITKVNGMTVFTVNDISFSLSSDRDGVVDFTVIREGKTIDLPPVTFEMQDGDNGIRYLNLDFYAGAKEKTFLGSVAFAGQWMLSIVRQVWLSFINLITGNFKLSELSGPVGVSTAIGQASSMGLVPFFNLIAFITVNLGVFNLLPLPALDGGRLAFLLIELVTRRRVNPKYEGLVHGIGLLLLLGLVAVVSVQDVLRLLN